MRCVSLLLPVLLVACSRAEEGPPGAGAPPPAPVAVEKLAPADLPAVYEYVGQTAGSRDVEVRARVAGILLKRNFDEGAPVKKGQSLYSLDAAPFDIGTIYWIGIVEGLSLTPLT